MTFPLNFHQVSNDLYHTTPIYLGVPRNTSIQLYFNSGYAFLAYAIYTRTIEGGARAAGWTAVSTLIYAFVTPLFRYLFRSEKLDAGPELVRTMCAIVATGYIASAFGNPSILNQIQYNLVYWIFTVCYFEDRGDLRMTNFVIPLPLFPR